MYYQQTEIERDYFDKLAKTTKGHWWGSDTQAGFLRYKIRAEYALSYIDSNAKKLLEVGCSAGNFTHNLKSVLDNIEKLIAIDISSELIAIAKKRFSHPRVEFITADIEKLDFSDSYFDAIIGDSILHHLNLKLALPELKRVLKKGGKLFFTEPNMLNPQIFLERKVKFIGKLLQNSPNETAFYRWQIKKILEKNGFSNVRVKPFDFIHPVTPKIILGFIRSLSDILETIPLIKEISGSLMITGEKP